VQTNKKVGGLRRELV